MRENETEARSKPDLKTAKPGSALSAAKSPAEIPPQQNRKHLTEPSWIEKMIYLSGLMLGEEEAKSDDEDPPKSEAA